ncbi:co-chaperone GroES [Candidatus Dojkabacteria bacterium]|uniref:Co-chaperonin GroES n=1 Tax=Candidatus Dojkabacteria bacterium TaxID=2099670 RepID=A0A847CZK4_9BACT|nr:co-chaperone GroES [Candidatus Dojkabacteria bacterium]
MSKDIKITPIGSRVLVSPDKVDEKTTGGLILPPTSTEDQKPETGIIVKLGEGKVKGKQMEFNVKVGDRVYFKKYSPDELEIDGERFLLLDAGDVLAVIK